MASLIGCGLNGPLLSPGTVSVVGSVALGSHHGYAVMGTVTKPFSQVNDLRLSLARGGTNISGAVVDLPVNFGEVQPDGFTLSNLKFNTSYTLSVSARHNSGAVTTDGNGFYDAGTYGEPFPLHAFTLAGAETTPVAVTAALSGAADVSMAGTISFTTPSSSSAAQSVDLGALSVTLADVAYQGSCSLTITAPTTAPSIDVDLRRYDISDLVFKSVQTTSAANTGSGVVLFNLEYLRLDSTYEVVVTALDNDGLTNYTAIPMSIVTPSSMSNSVNDELAPLSATLTNP